MSTHDTIQADPATPTRKQRAVDMITEAGAIVVVALGLIFVFILGLAALGTVPGAQKAAVVTAAFTVLGTIVGAYFGVKVGAAGREQAENARNAESVKVQELTARVQPDVAKAALDSAYDKVQAAVAAARPGKAPVM